MHDPSGDVTQLVQQINTGDKNAVDRLMGLVYDELKLIARKQRRQERIGHTLNTTALVHEAYVKLAQQDHIPGASRAGFFYVARLCMGRVLLDWARQRAAQKRGGGQAVLSLDEQPEAFFTPTEAREFIDLHAALERMAAAHPRWGEIAQYRYFLGMTTPQAAEVMGISVDTAKEHWKKARAWLRRHLGEAYRPA